MKSAAFVGSIQGKEGSKAHLNPMSAVGMDDRVFRERELAALLRAERSRPSLLQCDETKADGCELARLKKTTAKHKLLLARANEMIVSFKPQDSSSDL